MPLGGVHPINPGSHKGKAVRQAIRKVGARLFFLPKYSPDLNPTEEFFSRIKHWVREARARTLGDIITALKEILQKVTPQECANFFVNPGYDPT